MSLPFPTSNGARALFSLGFLLLGACEFRERDDKIVEVKDRKNPNTQGFERVLDEIKEMVRLWPPGPQGYTDDQIHNFYRLFSHRGSITEAQFLEMIRSLDSNHDSVISDGDIRQSIGEAVGAAFLDPPLIGYFTRDDVIARAQSLFPTARYSIVSRLADRLMQYDEPVLGGDGDGFLTRPEVLVASAFVNFGSRVDLWNTTPDEVGKFRDVTIHSSVEDHIILSELKTRVLQQYWTNFGVSPAPREKTREGDLRAEQGLFALRGDRAMKYAKSAPQDLARALRSLVTPSVYEELMSQIYDRREFGGDGNLDTLSALEALFLEMDVEWAHEVFAEARARLDLPPLPTFEGFVGAALFPGGSVREVLATVGNSLFTTENRGRIEKALKNGLVRDGVFGDREAVYVLFFARLTNMAFELFAGEDLQLSKGEAKAGLRQLMGDLADARMIDYFYGRNTTLSPIDLFELLFKHLYPRLRN